MGQSSRRWIGSLAVVAALVAAVAVALRLQVTIPSDANASPIARATVSGPVTPDGQMNASPNGQACLDRISSGSGSLDLCWEAYRFGGDGDPRKDYFILRLYGSYEGLRWLVVRSQLVGNPGDGVYDVWPEGTYEGGCRKEPVSMMVPMGALPDDYVCGRTEAHLDSGTWSHRLVWQCEGCLFPASDSKGLAMYTVVGLPDGTNPSWNLFATVGT